MIFLIQHFEADFPQKVSLKILNSFIILKTFTQEYNNSCLSLRKLHHSNMPNYHAREPLNSNSAVIAGWLQSTRAHNILFWFTVIHSMSRVFTTTNFHDDFSFEVIN